MPTSGSYFSGTVLSLRAMPDSGWQFEGWTGDVVSTTTPISLTMDSNKVITATFSPMLPPISYSLSVNVVGRGSVMPTSGSYFSGTVLSLRAMPDSGWQFEGWTGDVLSTTTPISLTMDSNKVITGTFTMINNEQKIFLPLILK